MIRMILGILVLIPAFAFSLFITAIIIKEMIKHLKK